jgi:hypothetical protein
MDHYSSEKSSQGILKDNLLVPRSLLLLDALFHVLTDLSRDGNERQIGLGVKADAFEVRLELADDLIIASLVPFDGRVVHLVDDDNELVYTVALEQESVLTSLPILFETCLEFTLTGRDNEKSNVRLSGTLDHAGDECLVSGRIKDGVLSPVGGERRAANFDCLALTRR